jgi:hypothetical protein
MKTIEKKLKIDEMPELLRQFGFKKRTIPNEFGKYRYVAVVGVDSVTLVKYTPNTKRPIYSETYYNLNNLKNNLEKNHY